ncbi:MAG: hypothetical protein OXF88_15620 [Rhodobacteraceae bacterium]|nr:hypothetical protein [Paracoccaceae bacterium]
MRKGDALFAGTRCSRRQRRFGRREFAFNSSRQDPISISNHAGWGNTIGKKVDSRFKCRAEERAARFGFELKYEGIGDRLMELRKEAFDKYDLRALWSTPGHATLAGMRGVAEALRNNGDLEAAYLAAEIIREVEREGGSNAA